MSFTNPHKKKSHGIKSGDRGGHRINASSSCPVRPIFERHICNCCLLAANQGNNVYRLFLKKNFNSFYLRKNYHDQWRSLFVADF